MPDVFSAAAAQLGRPRACEAPGDDHSCRPLANGANAFLQLFRPPANGADAFAQLFRPPANGADAHSHLFRPPANGADVCVFCA